jgi:hypothetical protein
MQVKVNNKHSLRAQIATDVSKASELSNVEIIVPNFPKGNQIISRLAENFPQSRETTES